MSIITAFKHFYSIIHSRDDTRGYGERLGHLYNTRFTSQPGRFADFFTMCYLEKRHDFAW